MTVRSADGGSIDPSGAPFANGATGMVWGGHSRATGAPERLFASLAAALEEERARWFYWLPVALGLGIALYFSLLVEPPPAFAALALVAALALRMALPRTTLFSISTAVILLVALGFALVTLRSAIVAAPVLDRRVGPVEVRGYVELIEPREGRGERLTVLVSRIDTLDAERTPGRVRVRTMVRGDELSPGDAIILKAHLAPPAAPVLPADFDFARYAYFSGIGAVGYALIKPERDSAAAPPPSSLVVTAAVQRLRQAIGKRIDGVLSGESAAIAKALVTGERGGISEATNAAYRDSGLFHILSISGLHMAIMGGAVFWLVRFLLALFPSIALRYPVKKWAALAAAAGSLAYLAISGSSFATVRSFITISIMFMAILLDRPAIALRNVALSALVILVLFPESLLDVGFQMSFAAVTALVAAFEVLRDRLEHAHLRPHGWMFTAALFFGGIVLTTLIASAAVTPFAVYHFHKSQQYAVLANLIAVPICNFLVMPAALATLVAMPVGLEAGPLLVMAWGIDAMSWTARNVASLPGAVGVVPAIPTAAFVITLAGGLWLLLWHTRWRLLGLVAIAFGMALAPFRESPDLLVGRDGHLVAVRTQSGLLTALPAPQSRFELKRWLESDGDRRSTGEAVASPGMDCDAVGCTATVKGTRVAVSRHAASIADDCASADVLILAEPAPKSCAQPVMIVDFFATRTAGTHAIYVEGPRKLHLETVAAARGLRPWSPPHPWSAEGRRRALLSADDTGVNTTTDNTARPHANDARGIRQASQSKPARGASTNVTSANSASVRSSRSTGIARFAAPIEMLDALKQPRPEVEVDDDAAWEDLSPD